MASSTPLSRTKISPPGGRFAPGICTTAIPRLPISRPGFHKNEKRTRGGAAALSVPPRAPLEGVAADARAAAIAVAAADEIALARGERIGGRGRILQPERAAHRRRRHGSGRRRRVAEGHAAGRQAGGGRGGGPDRGRADLAGGVGQRLPALLPAVVAAAGPLRGAASAAPALGAPGVLALVHVDRAFVV